MPPPNPQEITLSLRLEMRELLQNDSRLPCGILRLCRESHWNLAKWVLIYIQGTKDYVLLYENHTKFVHVGYSNADFVGSVDDRASTSGYLMNMG
jgi:hypothetical protein